MNEPRPERIAAAARALGVELREQLALHADAIGGQLEHELSLVAWDRQQIIGQMQLRQWELREQRFRRYGGAPVRIIERRDQPLECLAPLWRVLRHGRRARLDHEVGAPAVLMSVVRTMARALGPGLLSVGEEPVQRGAPPPEGHEEGGVAVARPRVALLDADVDEELAAYVLARSCLRRGGADPRAIRRAFLVGRSPRLERHLRRLWVGAHFGPASDPDVFAGPADAVTRDAFLEAHEAWAAHPDVEMLCEGGLLKQADPDRIHLAPAVCRTTMPAPDLPLAGPLLVLVEGEEAACSAAFGEAGARGEQRLVIAGGQRRGPARDEHGSFRRIRGALLVDRLPPGLPGPRPV